MEKATNGAVNIQDEFLHALKKDRQLATIYLMNGYKLAGKIKGFDKFTVLLDSNGQDIMVFKHAISTVGIGPGMIRKDVREGTNRE